MARRRLSFGGIGGVLVVSSSSQSRFSAPGRRTRAASAICCFPRQSPGQVLQGFWGSGYHCAAEIRRFNSTDCAFNQATKLLSLFLNDGSAQVLDLDQTLAYKYYLGNVRTTRDPRVADKLGIQREQSIRLFRVPARRCFPFQQATLPIEFPYGVDIGDEVVAARNLSSEFDLQVALGLADPDTIVIRQAGLNRLRQCSDGGSSGPEAVKPSGNIGGITPK